MKAFIFIFALIACLMLARGLPLEEETIASAAAVSDVVAAAAVVGTGAVAEPGVAVTDMRAVCKSVGEFCSQSDDCCTLRCASYIHRCVT